MKFGRMQIGLLVTALYAGGVVALVVLRWSSVKEMSLNELGDFSAGAAGPIAFLWLVLGYFQQGDELSQNTEALKMQAAELKNSVAAQEALAAATREQVLIAEQQAQAHLQRMKRLAQPNFEVDVPNIKGIFPGNAFSSITVTNVGAECAALYVHVVMKGEIIFSEYVGRLARHEDRKFDFDIVKPSMNFEFEMRFFYADQEGEQQTQDCSILIGWNEDSSMFEFEAMQTPKWDEQA